MNWKQQCIEVAERHGLDEPMFCANEPHQDPFEDDGSLHIVKRGVRAVFGVGLDDKPGSEQNRLTRLIMADLGLAKKINDRVLVEEDEEEDEDEYCAHCGRGGY